MHLEFQRLLQEDPGLEDHLNMLPGRVFSGKDHPSPGSRAVFFCYGLPAPTVRDLDSGIEGAEKWTEEAGFARWYLYDLATGEISEDMADIIDLVRSQPDTPRRCTIERETLTGIRAKMDKHIKNTYLKQVQAPVGVKPSLKAWMELS
ncbi:MAG: hypothetical protein AB1603_05890 [Chloroflexota bacterium]